MLCSVAINHLKTAIILLQWKVDLQDMGTGFNNLEDAMSLLNLLLPGCPHVFHVHINQFVLSHDAGLVEEIFYHFKEARVLNA